MKSDALLVSMIAFAVFVVVLCCSCARTTPPPFVSAIDSTLAITVAIPSNCGVIRIRECEYVTCIPGDRYYGTATTLLHAGDCSNPIHKSRGPALR